jgi:hypothetical protein
LDRRSRLEIKKNFKLVNKVKDEMSTPALYEAEYETDELPYWVEKEIDSPVGKIRVIKTELNKKDKLDGYKVRWGINRNNYKVSPGLYAIGNPDSKSNVLVTANYKLTLDKLRVELSHLNLCIVILDTKGINVWCAAGKGTFGTTELIGRIRKVQLNKVVEHNKIILPQLSAPGVSAHVVTKMSGFKVIYGPIRAKDIREYLKEGLKASEAMREVKFNLMDRLVVTPIEIVHILKNLPIIYFIYLILNIARPEEIHFGIVVNNAFLNSMPYFSALFIGAFLFPILLPYIPFNAFSLKGMLLGLIWSTISIGFGDFFKYESNMLVYIGNTLIITSIITFLGLNFTGSTTYTSLSGVKLETKWATIGTGAASLVGVFLIVINSVIRFVG